MSLTGSTVGELAPKYANAEGYNSSSTTSLDISLGSKNITVQPAKSYAIGNLIRIFNTSANYMLADVTGYDPVTGILNVNVTFIAGSGTYTSWKLSLTGPKGDRGNDGSVVSTNSITVTNIATLTASNGLVILNMPGNGYYVKMPDARTIISKSTGSLFLSNICGFDVGVRDNAGNKLGWIRAGKSEMINCTDNTTIAGSWSGNLAKHAVTAYKYTGSPQNNYGLAPFTKYDITNDIEAIVLPKSGLQIIYYDKINIFYNDYSTSALISADSYDTAVGETSYEIVVASTSGTQFRVSNVVTDSSLNVSRTTQTLTIASVASGSQSINSQNTKSITLQKINNTTYLATIACTNGNIYAVAFTVVAGVITLGSVQTIASSLDSSLIGLSYHRVYSTGNNIYAVLFLQTNKIRCNTFSVSGTTISNITVDSSVTTSSTANIKFCDPYSTTLNKIPVFYTTSTGQRMAVWTIPSDGVTGISVIQSTGTIASGNVDCLPQSNNIYFVFVNAVYYNFVLTTTLDSTNSTLIGVQPSVPNVTGYVILSGDNNSSARLAWESSLLKMSNTSLTGFLSTPQNYTYLNPLYPIDLYGKRFYGGVVNSKNEISLLRGIPPTLGSYPSYTFKYLDTQIKEIENILPLCFRFSISSRLDEVWALSNYGMYKVECV